MNNSMSKETTTNKHNQNKNSTWQPANVTTHPQKRRTQWVQQEDSNENKQGLGLSQAKPHRGEDYKAKKLDVDVMFQPQ